MGVVGLSNKITIKPRVDTSSLSDDIDHALNRSWFFDASDLQVSAQGGCIHLTGTVGSQHDWQSAAATALAVLGATDVIRTSSSAEPHMAATCPTLFVNLEPGQSNAELLQVTSSLAERLGAAVIGVAARQPTLLGVSGACYVSPELVNEERAETEAEMSGAEAEFRGAFHGTDVEWRSSVSYASPSDYIVDQARHADLLMTGRPRREAADPHAGRGWRLDDAMRPARARRPSSVGNPVPRPRDGGLEGLQEARRAALDALPLLKRATHVTVVEIAADEDEDMAAARERLADLSRWLAEHGIAAEVLAAASSDNDLAQLEALARSSGANLIVAGAYGRSRLREWAFGGVTRTLLQRPATGDRCAMLSQ